MAGTVTANMATISMCDLVADFTGVGGTLAQNVDVNLEGSACIQNYSSSGAARGADRTGTWSLTNQNIYAWFATTKASAIPVLGANGMRLRLASATNDWSEWDIFGGDTLPHGGWIAWTIRTSVTPSRTGTNPCTLGSVTTIGWRCGTTGTVVPSKIAIYFDAFRYGTGLNLYAGTSGSPATVDDLITAESTSFYGAINKTFGIYYLQGQLNIGSTSAGVATYFQDSSKVVVFKNVSVGASFYNVTLQGNATGDTQVYWGSKPGDDGISGFSLRTESEAQTPKFNITATSTNISKFGIYGTTLNSADIIYGQAYNANKAFVSVNFEKCARLEPGTGIVDRCFFISAAGRAVLMDSTSHNITNCNFISCQTGIHISTAGSYTFNGLKFSGNTYDIENSVAATDAVTQVDVRDADQPLGNGTITAVGQSFSGNNAALANVVFTLSKTNTSTTGNLYVKIYASTGSSPNYLPTGSALATSQIFDVSTLTTSPVATTIYFNTQDQNITLASGTQNFVAVLEYSAGTAANYVNVGIDQSSPAYAGNLSTYTSPTWTSAGATKDAIFKVRTGGVVIITLANGANPSTAKLNNSNAIPGVITINTGVNITVHVQDDDQANIVGASVQVFQISTPSNIIVNTTTDGSGNAVASTILSTGEPLTIRVRLSPSGATRYLPGETSTTVPASNGGVTVTLNTDSLIGATTSGTIGGNFAVNTTNKTIKNSGTTTYTVNELYTWLMDYFDAADYMDDSIPMSIQTPSEYTLLNGWFLDDASTKYLTSGAIQTSGWDGVIYVLTMSGTPTNPVSGDIGKTVTNGGGSNTGILLDYTTTSPYKWYVRKVLGTFGAEAVTITPSGTGAGTISTATTAETIWSNIYTLGSLVTGTTLDVYQNDAQITPFWSSGHFDILIRVKETTSLIDSGKIMIVARLYGTLYDNFLITAASGRSPVPLAAFDDGNNNTASGTVGAYSGFTFTYGYASKNIGNVNGLQPYDCVVECNYHTLLEIYEYLKYVTRTGSGTTLNGVNGEYYTAVGDIRLTYSGLASGPFVEGNAISSSAGGTGYIVSLFAASSILVIRNTHGTFADTNTLTSGSTTATISGTPNTIIAFKQAPFGTYAGGQFFGARGVWLDHVHADYVNDYELIDSAGVTQAPPATVPVTVSNTAIGDRVSVFRALDANGTIDKTYLESDASANTIGSSTYTVDSGTTIPVDTPSVGKIRLRDASTNSEHRIRYASWTGLVFTLITAITGSTTSDGGTNVIHNSGASFLSADIMAGDIVRNTTDGSWAHVVSVDSDIKITTTNLSDGFTWTSGDGYSFHTLPVTYENATNVDTAYVPYLDSIATGTTVSTSVTYSAVRNISTRVRIKGLQPYTNNITTLTSTGYSTSVTRIDDTIAI